MATAGKAPGNWRKLAIVLIFAGGVIAFFALEGQRQFTLAALKENRAYLLAYVERHYWYMLLAMAAAYVAAVALSLPIATLLSLAAGYAFGAPVATAMIVACATLGAAIAFGAARYVFYDSVMAHAGARTRKIIAGIAENGFYYLLSLRLVPLFPFWLVNLASGLTPLRGRVFVAATALGIFPGSFLFASMGESLGSIEANGELLPTQIALRLGLLGIFVLAPVAIRKLRKRPPSGAPGGKS
ncbi:MAG: TVP38/TMEM64 family protein [Betaproteobacteria bacterium]|nr:TVP38/TMEM64 family protein [Betaproteobacteria bacterium]